MKVGFVNDGRMFILELTFNLRSRGGHVPSSSLFSSPRQFAPANIVYLKNTTMTQLNTGKHSKTMRQQLC